MESKELLKGVVGGIVAGFSIGVGFLIAQRMMSKWAYGGQIAKKESDIANEIKKGVADGVKQANLEQQASNFAAMQNFSNSNGGNAKRSINRAFSNRFAGFDGNPQKMNFSSEPIHFGMSPNGNLNSF